MPYIVFVKLLNGDTHTIEGLQTTDNIGTISVRFLLIVGALKNKLQDLLKMPISNQRLIFAGT